MTTNQLSDSAHAKHPIFQKFAQPLKEWGGAATLLIAILYTFPFDVFDRFAKWADKDILIARQTLADAATISIEAAKTATQVSNNPDVAQWYYAKFYNVLYPNRDAVRRAARYLKSTEVQQIAAYFVLIGQVKDGLGLFEIALRTAKAEGLHPGSLLRDKALALYAASPVQDVVQGRAVYKEALVSIAQVPAQDARLLTMFVMELAGQERLFGDWKCGRDLQEKINGLARQLTSQGQVPQAVYERLNSPFDRQRVGQPTAGCSDLYDLIPKGPEYVALPAAPPAPLATPASTSAAD
jgi:hypothetical protein